VRALAHSFCCVCVCVCVCVCLLCVCVYTQRSTVDRGGARRCDCFKIAPRVVLLPCVLFLHSSSVSCVCARTCVCALSCACLACACARARVSARACARKEGSNRTGLGFSLGFGFRVWGLEASDRTAIPPRDNLPPRSNLLDHAP
jgi:hypothetical protein